MIITRRHFLKKTIGSASLVCLGQEAPGFLWQASAQAARDSTERVLVVLQLSGGNDGLNTVAPFAHDVYQANRFTLRVEPQRALKINDEIGFHPALTGFAELLEREQLAVVQGVGYPNPDRSHFNSMDIWHTGVRDLTARRTGWLGRYLDGSQTGRQAGWRAIHVGGERQPLALIGERASPPTIESLASLRLEDEGDANFRAALADVAGAPREGSNELLEFLRQNAQQAVVASDQIRRAIQDEASPVGYPKSGLSERLRLVAQLIDAGLGTRIYYLTLPGFDTHADQVGAHESLLRELGDGLRAFLDDLTRRDQAKRVLVMAFSEFGRRLRENASRGTDHGTAAPMFLAGGSVPAGLIGDHPSLDDLEEGDVKFHTDFRRVYAGALEQWLDADSVAVLGAKFEPVQVVRSRG